MKEGGKSSSTKTLPEDCDNQLSDGGGDTRSEDSATSMCSDVSGLQEKVIIQLHLVQCILALIYYSQYILVFSSAKSRLY